VSRISIAQQPPGLDFNQLRQLASQQQFDQLAEQISQATNDPEVSGSTLMMAGTAVAMLSQARPEQAAAIAKQVIQRSSELLKSDSSPAVKSELAMAIARATNNLVQVQVAVNQADAALPIVEESSRMLANLPLQSSLTAVVELAYQRASLLARSERWDTAQQMLQGLFDRVAGETEELQLSSRLAGMADLQRRFQGLLGGRFPEQNQAMADRLEAAFEGVLSGELGDELLTQALPSWFNHQMMKISQLTNADPAQAMSLVTQTRDRLASLRTKLGEIEGRGTGLADMSRNLDGVANRLETSLMRERMVGEPASELQADAFVNMPETSLEQLRGKVVLLDFWAVWCGPCIATFPHLRDWHERFGPEGLQIIGVTRYYGYQWNEETARAARGEDVSNEEELEMLEMFRQHHQLDYGFLVGGPDNTNSQAYGVTGIPQAVLVDKQGKVRMIRVGSGDANAKALEEMIEQLLAE
jgi:thiol-disulfide isomerase/thioredoxin